MPGPTETPAHVEATITSTINDNAIAEHNVLYARSRVHVLAADRRRVLMDQINKRIAAVTADMTMATPARENIIKQLQELRASMDPGFLGYNQVTDRVRNTLTPNQQYGVAAGAAVGVASIAALGWFSWKSTDPWYKKAGLIALGALSLPLAYVGFNAWQAPQDRARQDVAVRMQNDIDLWNRLRTAGPIDVFGNPELATGRNMLLASPEATMRIGGNFVRIQTDANEVVFVVSSNAGMTPARRWVIDLSYDRPGTPTSPDGVQFNALLTQGLLENPRGPNPTFLRVSAMLGRTPSVLQREQGELLIGGQAGSTGPGLGMYLSQADVEALVTAMAATPGGTTTGEINGRTVHLGPPVTPPAVRQSAPGRKIRFTEVTRPAPGTPERGAFDAVNAPPAQAALADIARVTNASLATAATPRGLLAVAGKLDELNALVPAAHRANPAVAAAARSRLGAALGARPEGAIFIAQGNAQFRLIYSAPDGFQFEPIVLAGDALAAVNFLNGNTARDKLNEIKDVADPALATSATPQALPAISTPLAALNAGVPNTVRSDPSVQAAALHRIATLVGARAGGNVFTAGAATAPNNRFRLAFSATGGLEFVLIPA